MTERGGHLGTGPGESENGVDEQQHVMTLLGLTTEVLGGPQTGQSDTSMMLSRRWYILLLPQDYLLLPLGGVIAGGGGVEGRNEVMYWHRGAYIIYYRDITGHSCIA